MVGVSGETAGEGVEVGSKVAVAVGSMVAVRVGKGVSVLVLVRLGQRVSVGWTVGPVGVLVNEIVGVAVRVGGTGVSVNGMVLVGKINSVKEGVELSVLANRFPPFL